MGIQRFIGRRPIWHSAIPTEQQMLEWTAAGAGRASWESCTTPMPSGNAYDRNSPIGTLDKAWDEAVARDGSSWT